jgi:pentalenic acid synthase
MRLPTGRLGWIVTSYEYARAVLSDPRFSADKLRPEFPRMSPNGLDKLKHFAPFLVNLDGAEHVRAKRSILNEFSPNRVAVLRPRIQHIVDRVVDDIESRPERPVDLVAALSYPTALAVQELLLGVPAADLATVRTNTENLLLRTGTPDEEKAAADALHRHLDGVLAEKEDRLGDDLVSRQILRHRAEYGHVDRYELASLVQLLAVGGYNSSATTTSLGVLALLTHPAELDAVRRDPDLMAGAVDELLRFYSVNDSSPLRLAMSDVRLGGTLIKAGDGVAVPLLPANRDPGLCTDPNRLDLLRRTRTRHIAFGHGPHRCVAHTLVPAQLEIVYLTLFRRLPHLALAVDAEELSYTYRSQTFGPVELPVTW